jgi:tetratricopeptide (TPR) repeat protein
VLLPTNRQRVALLACAALAVIALIALPTSRARVTGTSPLASETVNGRQLLWGETLHVIASNPVVGVGVGGFVDALPRHQTLRYEREIGPQTLPDSPENWLLQAAVAGGPALLLISMALAALLVAQGLRAGLAEKTAAGGGELGGMFAGVAGYGTALLFYFTSPASTPLATLLVGAVLAQAPTRQLRGSRTVACSAFGVLTVVLVLAALAEIPLRAALVAAGKGQLAPAQADFRAARTLRPWDPAIDAAAGHAFAELTSAGVAGAAAVGEPWAARALRATPDSVQVIADAATIDLAQGRARTAAALLQHALDQDPLDGDLRVSAAAAALVLGRRSEAITLAEQALVDDPGNPRAAELIALARR